MSKEILLLGEFSTGKSAFINMLMGVSILPERLESTDMPIIKIHSGTPTGIWLHEPNQKNSKALDKFIEIPKDWDSFEYAEITIPQHPLLKNGLVFCDTPGINSTNPHHNRHLDNFINESHRNYKQVYFFVPGNITATSIEFIKKIKKYWDKLNILIYIKEIRNEPECRLIEKQVKKTVSTQLGNIPVELLYWRDLNEELNDLSEEKREGLSDYELIKDWDKRKTDILELRSKYKNSLIGDKIFEIITEIANEKVMDENYYQNLNIETLQSMADKFDPLAQYYLGIIFESEYGYLEKSIELLELSALNGCGKAQWAVAEHYKENTDAGLPLDLDANNELYQKYLQLAVINNVPQAIAEQYFEGINTIKNSKAGFSVLINSYDSGNVSLASDIAICFEEGKGVEVDLKRAESYKRTAYKNNEKQGSLGLALFLIKQQDKIKVEEGLKLLTTFSSKGHYYASLSLAIHYRFYDNNENNKSKIYGLLKTHKGKSFLVDILLARCYQYGYGIIKDHKRSFDLLRRVYDKKSTIMGLDELIKCYVEGRGTGKNIAAALEIYEFMIKSGSKEAKFEMSKLMLDNGIDIEKGLGLLRESAAEGNENAIIWLIQFIKNDHPEEAIRWLKKLEYHDEALVYFYLGSAYLKDSAIRDDKKAVVYLEKAASKGNAEAQNLLGKCYFNGWGTIENNPKAFEWVKKAALQGLPIAELNMGYFYMHGIGTKENLPEAINWYKKAALQGEADAQFFLGSAYLNGNGLNKNETEAFRLFKLSAEQGDFDAQNMLGRCYEEGWGTIMNLRLAFENYKMAADNGHVNAQFNLAILHFNGTGCDVDLDLAFKYFEASAGQGLAIAQNWLGYIYQNGLGVIPDINRAWNWYEKAADQGNDQAIQAINELNRQHKVRR